MADFPPNEVCFPENIIPFKKRIYTKEIHAIRVLSMIRTHLAMGDELAISFCPASEDFDSDIPPVKLWDDFSICSICTEFVGMESECCPCFRLGTVNAYCATVKNLFKKGFIELAEKDHLLDQISSKFNEPDL